MPNEVFSSLPWWLQGNYAPVAHELTAHDLQVTGALPPELDGVYLRNGPNPMRAPSAHWFLGQGMVHGVRLRAGKAEWYRNRALRTPLLERAPRPGPPMLADTASNVALAYHARRLLSLGEQGLPYELSRADLSTLGACDFRGKLRTNMTAHPKIDPETGELLMFGYDFVKPYLTFHRVSADGELVESRAIDVPAPAMMHDFAITRRYVVFMDLPIVFRLDCALRGDAFPFRWDDRHRARIGVMARGGAREVRWFEIDPCFVFHVMNAYEDGASEGGLVLDAVRYPKLWDGASTMFDTLPALHRFGIDLARGSVHCEALDDRALEFPQIDPRRTGRPYRYGFALRLRASSGDSPGGATGLLRYDHARGSVQARELAADERCDELVFVPASPHAGEDEGYLLGYVHAANANRSDLIVLDASDITAPAIARVHLPQRVPFGFHGLWVPGP
jgi:carotenoid cleavage dioxygenase